MKIFFLFLILMMAILIESTFIQLPLVLLLLFVLTVVYESEWILPIGLLAGFFLDGLTLRHFGESSLFFLVFLFLVFLYERKFELKSIGFVVMMSALGSFLFFLIFGHVFLILQVLLSTAIGTIMFLGFSLFIHRPEKDILTTWKK